MPFLVQMNDNYVYLRYYWNWFLLIIYAHVKICNKRINVQETEWCEGIILFLLIYVIQITIHLVK